MSTGIALAKKLNFFGVGGVIDLCGKIMLLYISGKCGGVNNIIMLVWGWLLLRW